MSECTYGLLITKSVDVGSEKVTVNVMRREGTASHPLNVSCSWNAEDRGRVDLCLYGWVSDISGRFILSDPGYVHRYYVDVYDAKAMAATLDRLTKAIRKAEAHEPGDVFMVFAKIVGATWVCEPQNERCLSYADTAWRWRTVAQGRDMFRQAIAEQEAALAKRKGLRAA